MDLVRRLGHELRSRPKSGNVVRVVAEDVDHDGLLDANETDPNATSGWRHGATGFKPAPAPDRGSGGSPRRACFVGCAGETKDDN